MKRVIVIVLVLCLLFSSISASASAGEKTPIDVPAVSQAWSNLINGDRLLLSKTTDSKNILVTKNKTKLSSEEELLIDVMNELLNAGAVQINSDGEFYTPDTSEQDILDSIGLHKDSIFEEKLPEFGTRAIDTIYLLDMCSNNYSTLQTVYWVAYAASLPSPGIEPWMATAIYWVSKVRSGGDWDYKSVDGYKPWYRQFYAYYDGYTHTITSEYIGNFNYGYTGSFLFDLGTLYTGSYVVSGFDARDVEDWPAITDGYNHAP